MRVRAGVVHHAARTSLVFRLTHDGRASAADSPVGLEGGAFHPVRSGIGRGSRVERPGVALKSASPRNTYIPGGRFWGFLRESVDVPVGQRRNRSFGDSAAATWWATRI